MANGVYITIAKCESSIRNESRNRHKRPLQLSSASGPLYFITMDILRPLPKTNQGSQYICVMTDRCFKLARAIFMSKPSSTHMENDFLDHQILAFGVCAYLLTNSGLYFVRKFFTLVCKYIGIKHLTATTYHLQSNGQAKQVNRTIIIRLSHYNAGHQQNWILYVQSLSYAYNTQIHQSTKRFTV